MGKFNEIQSGYALSNDQIQDEYYLWLISLVNIGLNDNELPYLILSKKLHSINYTWFVPNDDNRAFDGDELKEKFADHYNIEFYEEMALKRPCTMLEMLIALSYRYLDNVEDLDDNVILSDVFLELLYNLGLHIFTDYDYRENGNHKKVDEIVYTMLNRTYTENGEGGLFPLKYTNVDQRNVEIWYQMNAYLREKYQLDY